MPLRGATQHPASGRLHNGPYATRNDSRKPHPLVARYLRQEIPGDQFLIFKHSSLRLHMNRPLIIAAFLAAVTAAIHIFAGGADVAAPLLASSMAEEPKLTLYAVWHMASVALTLSAVALFVGSLPRHAQASRYLVLFVSALWGAFGVVFLVVVAMQPDSGWLLKLPQWILLLPVGVLGLWAHRSGSALKACDESAKSR